MEIEVPPGLELMTDVSSAAWVEERLWPYGRYEGARVGEVVPEGFEAYARVFHPADLGTGREVVPVRWADLAAECGKLAHPEMAFEAIVRTWNPECPPWDGHAPEEGSLPQELGAALADALRAHTRTPQNCWFCLWDGFGILEPGGQFVLTRGRLRRWKVKREAFRRAREFRRLLDRYPRVRTNPAGSERLPSRKYLLFRGPVEAVTAFRFQGWFQSPNIWWPDDRAWCVATEIDADSTFVGGSRACVRAILARPELEALPTEPMHRWDVLGDTVNWPPPGRVG